MNAKQAKAAGVYVPPGIPDYQTIDLAKLTQVSKILDAKPISKKGRMFWFKGILYRDKRS